LDRGSGCCPPASSPARHGSITKTGSKYARRSLVEASWHDARARIGRTLYERQEGLPDHVLQIASRAQHRLYRIHKRMRERQKRAT
jgi:transposase